MTSIELRKMLEKEVEFTFARSSGPGGQNVNKVNSKAILYWDYLYSDLISDRARRRFEENFGSRISSDQKVIIAGDESRDQLRNKLLCLEKLVEMIEAAIKEPKKRYKTKPSRSSVEKRLRSKTLDSKRKQARKVDY